MKTMEHTIESLPSTPSSSKASPTCPSATSGCSLLTACQSPYVKKSFVGWSLRILLSLSVPATQ